MRSKTFTATLAWVLFLALPAAAADRFAAAAAVAEQIRQQLTAPGLSVAAAVDGRAVWSAGFGLADVENDVPARGDTVYRIASISKTFGATAVLQLADRKKVGVDDPVGTYVPSFPHAVTLRQIMTHTSGIRHYKPGEMLSTVRYEAIADAIGIFKDDPLQFPAGTRVLYSTYAYNLLQGVVETASGQSLEAYLEENIDKPAGLTQTSLEWTERIVQNRARGYVRVKGELRNAPYVDNSNKWLGGGMLSSAEDLIRYSIALDAGRLVSAESLKLMSTAGTLANGTPVEYSLGWELSSDDAGNWYVDKYGSGTGVSTYLLRIPEKKFAVAVLVNLGRGNIRDYAKRIADAVMASTTAP